MSLTSEIRSKGFGEDTGAGAMQHEPPDLALRARDRAAEIALCSANAPSAASDGYTAGAEIKDHPTADQSSSSIQSPGEEGLQLADLQAIDIRRLGDLCADCG